MPPEPCSHTFQIRRALLREDELQHESKRKAEVAKNTMLSMFCCHCYWQTHQEAPSNQGVEPIERVGGGGGIRTHGSMMLVHSRPPTSAPCSKSVRRVHRNP